MSYNLVLRVKIWQILIASRLELLKTHHCALSPESTQPLATSVNSSQKLMVEEKKAHLGGVPVIKYILIHASMKVSAQTNKQTKV